MRIDENTKGSVANQEAIRLLRGWLVALYLGDFLICIMVGSSRGLSESHVMWLALKSLFFSYVVGIFLLIVAVRVFGRAIGIRRVYPVGLLRYFVMLGCLSIVMGIALVYSEPLDWRTARPPDLLNSQTAQWQAVKDAKAYCVKQGKTVLIQKTNEADFSVAFVCI